MNNKLFSVNEKLKNASHYTVNFGIPALKTCPMADKCKSYCYATKGAYAWPVVKNAYERRFQATKKDNFTTRIMEELFLMPKVECIRIHDSGDFYNQTYLCKWLRIAGAFPERIFYCYTKRVKLVKQYIELGLVPINFKPIYSIGGNEDHLIDVNKDRHSRIFNSLEELEAHGYVDASHDDSIAWKSTNNKIGLVIH